jgi:hypothetical protein
MRDMADLGDNIKKTYTLSGGGRVLKTKEYVRRMKKGLSDGHSDPDH